MVEGASEFRIEVRGIGVGSYHLAMVDEMNGNQFGFEVEVGDGIEGEEFVRLVKERMEFGQIEMRMGENKKFCFRLNEGDEKMLREVLIGKKKRKVWSEEKFRVRAFLYDDAKKMGLAVTDVEMERAILEFLEMRFGRNGVKYWVVGGKAVKEVLMNRDEVLKLIGRN